MFDQTEVCRTCSYLRINTWTYISSFQRSASFAFVSSSETIDYTEPNLVVKPAKETSLTFLFSCERCFPRGKYVIYTSALPLSSGVVNESEKKFFSLPNITFYVFSKIRFPYSGAKKNGPLNFLLRAPVYRRGDLYSVRSASVKIRCHILPGCCKPSRIPRPLSQRAD